MTTSAATARTKTPLEEATQYRKEAEEAKQQGNYEFAFLLLDKADKLEQN